jgi:WD40 repeat protein
MSIPRSLKGQELRHILKQYGLCSTFFSDKTIRIWDVKTGKEVVEGHTDSSIRSVAFSPDGTSIISGSVDKAIRIWDSKTGEAVMKASWHIPTL